MTLKHIMRRTFVPILNFIGMSISLMVFIVLFAQVWFDYRFNRNFEDYKNIYRGGMKQQQDSVALSFAVDGRVIDLMIPRNYSIPFLERHTCNYIPMETYLNQPISINDEIPIFAVTGGICGAMDFMGTPMFTQDYCGLRDKHLHPKEWVNIDDVHNYCFYTIEFH